MIKATSVGPQGHVTGIFLGLSEDNWNRLRAGQPIRVQLCELSDQLPDVSVVLLGGDTEDSIVEDLRALAPVRSVQS